MAKKQNTSPSGISGAPTRDIPSQPSKGLFGNYSLNIRLCVLLGLISFFVYANSLKNGFVFDDNDAIRKNTAVARGISAIPEILSTPYRNGSIKNANDYYRPLSLVTFAVEYQFFGLSPLPYHFTNILLFIGCVILLFLFFDEFFEHKKTEVAFIACLLFAVHPIHTEVVANIKSRDELLCFFFAFLSLYTFQKYATTGKMLTVLTGTVYLFLSLLAKETSLTFLAVIPLIFFFYKNEHIKRSTYITAGTVLAIVVVLSVRYIVLHAYNADKVGTLSFIENPLVKTDITFESKAATAILMSGYYIKFLLFPYPLISDYSFNSIPLTHFTDPLVLLSLAVYLFIAVIGIKGLLAKNKDPYAFVALYYLATISLFTNFFFLLALGERFSFFSSVSFCLVVALAIEKYMQKKEGSGVVLLKNSKVLGLLVVLSLLYGSVAIARNADWVDDYTLCKVDVVKSPDNSRLNYFVGYELVTDVLPTEENPATQDEIRQEALMYFRRAINIYPELADAYANMGFMFFDMGMLDSAEIYDKLALLHSHDFPSVSKNLGKVYFVAKKYRQALDLTKEELKKHPEDVELYTNILAVYGTMGLYDSAIYYANLGLAVNPTFNTLYENIALCYKLMGKPDSAGKYEAIARKSNPGFRLR